MKELCIGPSADVCVCVGVFVIILVSFSDFPNRIYIGGNLVSTLHVLPLKKAEYKEKTSQNNKRVSLDMITTEQKL